MSKYEKWYNQIIDFRKTFPYTGDYVERHHIIPMCIGGIDEPDNIVCLSAKEHFICHLLLSKIHNDYRLKFALLMMSRINHQQERYVSINSNTYEYIRKQHSIACTIRNKNRSYSSGHIIAHNKVTGIGKRFHHIDDVPVGWVRGSTSHGKTRNKGKVYWHNQSGKIISLLAGETPPDGYIKGRPDNKHIGKIFSGKKYFHDPATCEEVRSSSCPPGWVAGRSSMWVTNGVENKLITKCDIIPEGFHPGRRTKRGHKQNRKNK